MRIDQLKSEQIHNQLQLQDQLIQNKGDQIEDVQATVKSQIHSFNNFVKQGCEVRITTKNREAIPNEIRIYSVAAGKGLRSYLGWRNLQMKFFVGSLIARLMNKCYLYRRQAQD